VLGFFNGKINILTGRKLKYKGYLCQLQRNH
jgi:hypothetical protein